MTGFHARRLPHYHRLAAPTFITWRLHGSLPPHRRFPPMAAPWRTFVAMDRLLDSASIGPFYLHRPEIAQMVVGARIGNQILGLTGKPFWPDESYDRLVRNQQEFERIVGYIEMNPVTAGIVTSP